MTQQPQSTADQTRRAYVIIGCALAIVAIAAGIQQSFGLFVRPISQELGWVVKYFPCRWLARR